MRRRRRNKNICHSYPLDVMWMLGKKINKKCLNWNFKTMNHRYFFFFLLLLLLHFLFITIKFSFNDSKILRSLPFWLFFCYNNIIQMRMADLLNYGCSITFDYKKKLKIKILYASLMTVKFAWSRSDFITQFPKEEIKFLISVSNRVFFLI